MSILQTRFAVCAAVSIALFTLTGCGGGDDSSTPAQSTSSSTAPPSEPAPPPPASTEQPTPAPTPAPATVAGSVSLQWVAPQANTDGSALQDLAGYTVVYGTAEHNLDQSVRIENPSIDRYVVDQLPAGTYYFAVKAFNSAGAESGLSNVVTKVVG